MINHSQNFTRPARLGFVVIVVLLQTFLTPITTYGQKEANIWYFGNLAGLDFNYTPPKALTNSAMNTLEGCASIADASGKLLFYTDGIKIWDKTHNRMKNGTGLKGHSSSTQSAVIVPKPGSTTNYYVFTVDGTTGFGQGGYYNEVDMSKNGGNGEVILKNQVLIQWSTRYPYESIGATTHGNGRDFWVCYVDEDSALKSFLVTPKGVQTTPVVSKPGNIHTGNRITTYMKFSSDNKYMVYGASGDGLKLVQFDDQTGQFKKAITIDKNYSYGVEFSPNSELLYTSRGYQYDITSFDSATINKSRYLYYGTTSSAWAAVQLGPDGRIYTVAGSKGWSSKIGFIGQPDKKGSACEFYADTLDVGGTVLLGLPTFLQTYLDPNFNVKGNCYGDTTRFVITEANDIDSVTWYFGDSTSITVKKAADTIRYGHLYKKPGEYETKTVFHFKDRKDTTVKHIVIRDFLATGTFLGKDIHKCRGDTVKIDLDHWSFESYQWSTGDSTKEVQIDSPGVYWVRAFPQFKCYYTDTIRVTDYVNDEIPDKLKLGGDRIKCPKDSIKLKVHGSFNRYAWSTGDTTQELTTIDSGMFIVRGYNHDICFSRDTIQVNSYPDAIPDLGPDSNHCSVSDGKIRIGDLDNPFAAYSWNTGSTDPFIFSDTTGTFILTVSNKYGCEGSDTIDLWFASGPPIVSLGGDRLFCDSLPNDSFIHVKNTGDEAVYKWLNNSTDSSRLIEHVGPYKVVATNACGTGTDSINIRILESPTIAMPSGLDTNFCDSVATLVKPDVTGDSLRFSWNTGDTLSEVSIKKPGHYQVISVNQCGQDTANVTMHLAYTPTNKTVVDTSICIPINHTLRLEAIDTFNTYQWLRDGLEVSDSDSIVIAGDGRYTLKVENYCGIYRDTFIIKPLEIPKVNLGPDMEACDKVEATLSTGNPNNEEEYEWSGLQTTPVIDINQPGTYWVRVSNVCGMDSDTIEVRLHSTSTPILPDDTLICDVETMELDASIPGDHNTYKWNNGDETPVTVIKADGWYNVQVSNPCMSESYAVKVSFRSTPVKVLSPEHVYCDTVSITELTAGLTNNDETYRWSNNQETRSIQVDEAGSYWVDVSNGCGAIRDSTEIRISISPEVNLGEDTSLCGEFAYELDAGNPGMQYEWSPEGEITQTILARKQDVYSVVVTNADGCQGHDRFEITDECRTRFYLPNAFSPNGDNLNDIFKPSFVTNVDQYQMEIFNRWGELLFVSDRLEEGWDGSYQGEECPIGLYTVLIKYYNHEKGGFERGQNQVMLLR
ncbi:MAG: gliding motility-associated C-terminal domain-containing protein [Bacteroidia bacterium]|nr:gliding motility-associated C-terminal domain-containing protein [Bacteroidia bacterium]